MPKILVVDDDSYLLEIYKEFLTKAGFETETAEDSVIAIAKFQKFNPDLLILDVEMPAGGGDKIFDRLRNLFMVNIPVIFSTGSPETVKEHAKSDNVMILPKPVKIDAILGAVKKLLKME